MRLATNQERLRAAAEYMRELIKTGWEFQDAQWKAATAKGLDANALVDEYDQLTRANRRQDK